MTYLGTRPPTVDEWEKYELHHRSRMSTKEFVSTLHYLSLDRENEEAFSQAYIKLLLELGSEIDVVFKQYCKNIDPSFRGEKITDYQAWKNGCKKLEFLGSSCIYPRMAPQPMKENCLLTSELEKTNEAYALAKISGLKYCEFLNRQYGTDYIWGRHQCS